MWIINTLSRCLLKLLKHSGNDHVSAAKLHISDCLSYPGMAVIHSLPLSHGKGSKTGTTQPPYHQTPSSLRLETQWYFLPGLWFIRHYMSFLFNIRGWLPSKLETCWFFFSPKWLDVIYCLDIQGIPTLHSTTLTKTCAHWNQFFTWYSPPVTSKWEHRPDRNEFQWTWCCPKQGLSVVAFK